MVNKRGVIVYYDIIEQLEDFSDEDVGKIFRAMVKYDQTGELPNFKGELKVAFKFIKLTLDRNKEEYETKCEKNRQNIQSYWNKRNTNEYDRIRTNTTATDKDIDKDIDIDNKKEKMTTPEQNSSVSAVKEVKHKYGNYKNVLLKDKELEKLKSDFSNYEELIKFLDEYIEMKGYKAKSHYLAIRKWVVDAVKEQDRKKKKEEPKFELKFGTHI